MKKRLSNIAPLQTGIVLAALYGAISLLIVPFFILAALLGKKGLPIGLAIFIPLLYAAVGFIGGIIAAAVYNLIAQWTGGIEFTLEDPPQT